MTGGDDRPGDAQADRAEALLRLLETEIWPQVPDDVLGRRLSHGEREAILGYGPDGV
jgi:hypothetical protein